MGLVLGLAGEQARIRVRNESAVPVPAADGQQVPPARLGLIWAVALAVLGSGGCHQAGLLVDLWVGNEQIEAVAATEDGGPARLAAWTTNRVQLSGANNETVSFQFALRVTGAPISRPDFRIRPLRSSVGQIGRSAVRLYRRHRVPIHHWPGWHIRSVSPEQRNANPLDVLVPYRAPRGGLPATLPPGQIWYFWVDVAIPKGTAAGGYSGPIELLSKEAVIGQVQVELNVWPFSLPDNTDIPFIAELNHRQLFSHHARFQGRPYRLSSDDWRDGPIGDRLDTLLNSTMRLLQRHRLTPVLPQLAPIVAVGAHDEVLLDWGQYDAVVAPYLDGRAFSNRVPLEVWPLPVDAVLRAGPGAEGVSGSADAGFTGAYLGKCAEHFARRGWLSRCYAVLPMVLPPSEETAGAVRRLVDIARQADARIPCLVRWYPQDLGPFGWVGYPKPDIGDSVDIWMPPAQFFDAEAMTAERAAGRKTWVAVDRPPFSGSSAVHAPARHVRVLSRQAQALGAQALFLGCVNEWPDAAGYPTPEDCIRVDPTVLIYPGGSFGLESPVPSVRLKHVRRSLQDAAYDKLLNQHGLEYVTRTVRESLVAWAGTDAYRTHFADGRPFAWAGQPGLFELAREIMARELVEAVHGKGLESRAEALARTTAWRRFMLETRQLRVLVDGVRVRSSGSSPAPAAEVECVLTVMNRRRVPFSGMARLVDLPDGWMTSEADQRSVMVPPNAARQVRLTARATVIPTTPGGYMILPVELMDDDGRAYRREVRVSCVSARSVARPIQIDGDLSDWPAGATNVASDFVLIAGTSTDQSGDGTSGPRSATVGFVMRDADYLYVAVNCEADSRTAPQQSRRKIVRYDDLVPVGEELVEILIDPYNTGTRSPADLFHIVVKQSGADLTERGIHVEPPCGAHEPWPVDLEVATRVLSGRWCAELRIPLSAFGVSTAERSVWGFNITRFDLAHQEFSTWSGAARNAYDPLSLGNLHLP